MRIRYLSDFPFSTAFGGKEVQMLQYRGWLTDRTDADVGLLDYWDRGDLDGVDVLHLFGLSEGFLPPVRSLRSRNADIRIVLSSNYYVVDAKVKLASRVGRRLPIPNYFTTRAQLLRSIDGLVVNSQAEGDQIRALFGELPYAPTVIPNAVEDEFTAFADQAGSGSFLRDFGIAPGYLLSVAFLDERKNTLGLLRAFLKVQARIGRQLVLIGGERFQNPATKAEVDGLLRANREVIVHIPSLDRKSDHLRSAYANCHGHVLVSHLETPGIASLEALAFGKPLLVGDCLPVREYFRDAATYVDPASERAIADGLVAFAARTPDSVPGDLMARYRLSTVGGQLKRFYDDLVLRPAAADRRSGG